MCDVCNLDNENWKFKCGDRPLEGAKLYCVYVGKVAKLNLCRIHSIELFALGEIRFLRRYMRLAVDLNGNKKKYTSGQSSGDFGF
jgi:hypothetical protein